MRRFFSRNDFSDLESQLRDGRPEAPAELLEQLVSRVVPAPTSRPASRPRLAAALVFSVVVLVALAAFGGVGYATSSISSAAKSSQHAVTSVVKQSGSNQSNKRAIKSSGTQSTKKGKTASATTGNVRVLHHSSHHPPWVPQYSHFVVICWRNHTIIVPRAWLPYIGSYTLGRCPRR